MATTDAHALAHKPSAGPWIPEWTFADRLRKARQAAGLEQRGFAEKLGVTASAFQQWESGRSRPRNVVAMSKRIELLTGVSATWLLGLDGEKPQPTTPAGAVARPEGFEPPTFCSVDKPLAAVIDIDTKRAGFNPEKVA